MFYLEGDDLPRSALEMASSLRTSLQRFFTLAPNENLSVRIEGGNYPAVDRFCIGLSGAKLEVERIPPKPAGIGQRRPALRALKLEISGHTIRVQETEVHLDLMAADVRFDYDRDKEGRLLLLLVAAGRGDVEVKISHEGLEALLLAQAKAVAARQGVVVEKVTLELEPIDQRSLAMAVRLTAKKLFMRATVQVKGQVQVDNELNARILKLSCEGEGPMGTLISNFLGPYLERLDDLKVPLMAISLGNIRLQDVQLGFGRFLEVRAVFGS
ncbi:MAG TPA: hypothetical protein VGD78_05385 [Chthoniobacterales bacterium]